MRLNTYFVISEVKGCVIIHMRGSWVLAEWKKIKERMHARRPNPFVLIKTLKLVQPSYPGNKE